MGRVRIDDGVLTLDGRRRLLLAGDYPYYRDSCADWPAKLAQMRACGLEVVTFYIPWRHHVVPAGNGEQTFVFTADGDDNRDVLRFIRAISAAGLLAVAKPGPFVHGEIQFGGLPDMVSPSCRDGRAASLAADGTPQRSQDLMLPSALCPDFLRDATLWLRRVWQEVVRENLYPEGPIIGLQLGNEGFYSDASMDLQAFDYSAPAVRRFRRFLVRKYRVIEVLNATYGVDLQSFGEVEPPTAWPGADRLAACLDWGEWAWRCLGEVFQEWSACFGERPPRLINLPPPARAPEQGAPRPGRLDAWLSRVRPEAFRDIHYGFTSWLGSAMADEESFLNYLLAAKRRRGPNVEENWSLVWSDPRCVHPIVPAYQALLALGAQATGFTVYTACATSSWGPHIALDRAYLARTLADPTVHDPPYGSAAPIAADGSPGSKFETLGLLTHFFGARGEALLHCRLRSEVTWGLYAPYSYVAAWAPPEPERFHGLRLPVPATEGLGRFARACMNHGAGFRLLDLEAAGLDSLAEHPRLVLSGGYFMSEAVQEKLAAYVENGGTLAMAWESPLFNERNQFCEILQDRLFGHTFLGQERSVTVEIPGGPALCRSLQPPEGAEPLLPSPAGVHGYRVQRGAGWALYLDVGLSRSSGAFLLDSLGLCALGGTPDAGEPLPFFAEYGDEGTATSFVIALSRSDRVMDFTCELGGRPLAMRLTGRGCAAVEVRQGRLAGCFVKAVNEMSGEACPVRVRYGADEISTDLPCDLSVISRDDGFDVRIAAGGSRPAVKLPERLAA